MAHIPDAILDKLRCARCNSLLSSGPIAILSNGESLCGRCTIPGSNIFQAHAYEIIATYFLFPCKYWNKHCAYYLNWNEVSDHEANCSFKSTCSILFTSPSALFKPENKLNLTQTIKLFNVPEPVLEILTCTTCGYYLSSTPIFVNNEGKSSCHRCFNARGQIPISFIQQRALEKILEIMLFPCIYRNRGCTRHFRFGSDTTAHEEDCSYGKVQRRPTTTMVDGKEKGVIETHSGHTYGTITPYSQIFVPQSKRPSQIHGNVEPLKLQSAEVQGAFFHELKQKQKMKRMSMSKGPESPNEIQTPNHKLFENQMSNESADNSEVFFRYPISVATPIIDYTNSNSLTKNQQAESPFFKAPSQFIYPENINAKSVIHFRTGSQNSQESFGESVSNYPQQSQVSKIAQSEPPYSNSFSYFDRFERFNNIQRSESFIQNSYNLKNPPKMNRTDSVNKKGDFNVKNEMAAVYPTEVHYGGSIRY